MFLRCWKIKHKTWKSHHAESSGIASHWPYPLWVWTTCLLSRWWTLCREKISQWLCWKLQNHSLSSDAHNCRTAVNKTHPVSLSSCSCSVMKHSSHTDRYSMAIFASFLYAFPMAPLLASNWTTFTTLCGEVKENDWGMKTHYSTQNFYVYDGWSFSMLGLPQLKDMGSLRGFSATRGTFVARAWHFRSKQDRSAHPTISIQPCKQQTFTLSKSVWTR